MAHPFRAMVFPLAAPIEVSYHAISRKMTHVPERFARVALSEVIAPAPQEGIDVLHDCGSGFVTILGSGFLTNRVAGFLQRFLGRHDVQIGFVAPVEVAVIPERVTEEIEALGLTQVHHLALFTVDAQSQPAFELGIEPLVDAFALILGEDHKIIGITDEFMSSSGQFFVQLME